MAVGQSDPWSTPPFTDARQADSAAEQGWYRPSKPFSFLDDVQGEGRPSSIFGRACATPFGWW